jgi:acetamidase/formamidase
MNTVAIVDLIKRAQCPWPRLETDDYIMTAGSARPLEDAFRIAQTELIRWIAGQCGMDVMDAYQLVSQGVEAPLANVVDVNYTSIAKMPKRYLPSGPVMDDTHAKLRAMAVSLGTG